LRFYETAGLEGKLGLPWPKPLYTSTDESVLVSQLIRLFVAKLAKFFRCKRIQDRCSESYEFCNKMKDHQDKRRDVYSEKSLSQLTMNI